MEPIKWKTWWVYVGPGEGQGVKHLITSVGSQIATFSELNRPDSGGFSWLGNPILFRSHFRPVPEERVA